MNSKNCFEISFIWCLNHKEECSQYCKVFRILGLHSKLNYIRTCPELLKQTNVVLINMCINTTRETFSQTFWEPLNSLIFLLPFLSTLHQGHSINSALHHSLLLWGPKGDLLTCFPSCGHLFYLDAAGSDLFRVTGEVCETVRCVNAHKISQIAKGKTESNNGPFATVLHTLNTQVWAMILQSQPHFSRVHSVRVRC